MAHWQIEFFLTPTIASAEASDAFDELALELVDAGADGTFSTNEKSITAFFVDAADTAVQAFAESIKHPLIARFLITQAEDKNWTQTSDELLKPLVIGSVTIVPVLTADAVPVQRQNDTLYLIPGMGFGTGHHATTSSIIALLQSPQIQTYLPKNKATIFDFGTGSGLLSIAAQHLFADASITAVDNDAAAVENAKENARINGFENITFLVADYITNQNNQLVLANIYAEVLVQHEVAMHEKLCASGVLILSGIMKEKQALIEESFVAARWRQISEISDPTGWITKAYSRND